MSVSPKLIAAISAAVGYYLQDEQKAPGAQQPQRRRAPPPEVVSSPFALAGRQAAMDIRWMWQMRVPR
ncbi:MAG TPA: hypothetical protein VEF34_15430 [Syntrophobacteraceae bacterium]|nr:hypothetical protein [Syntrophobacteraceae bacterium]